MKTIRVVAAIIQNNDKIFATQRGYGAYKDYWEFPGGKIEANETSEHAIVREIQEELANEEHLVINRQALRTSGLKAIEHYNLSSIGMGTYAAVDPSQENSRYKYSEKDLDKLEKTILSCSGMKTQDTAISIILIEEMPPYFLGQKDLASVIKIAQDRAQKVLDERK